MNIRRVDIVRAPLLKGFTLVELMIVIVVIAILASITIVAYNGVQPSARDAKRKADLHIIGESIQLYRQKKGNDIQSGSGCGQNGDGIGYFNYSGSGYPESIENCLKDAGYLDGSGSFADPSNCITWTSALPGKSCSGTSADAYVYLKYTCGTGDSTITYLYAHLETETTPNFAKDTSCGNGSSTALSHGLNYQLIVK